jgi:MYXO-CTERM domain-containing protein
MGQTQRRATEVRHPYRTARWLLALAVTVGCLLMASVAAAIAPVSVTVLEDTADRTVLQYQIGTYQLIPMMVGNQPYTQVTLGKESPLKVAGAPELPTVNRSILIADDAQVTAQVVSQSYHEVSDIDVVPSKGIVYRSVNPSSVAHSFGPTYQADQLYPNDLVTLGTPYLLRNYRGVVVTVQPFQYNPITRVLRIYDTVTVEIARTGTSAANALGHRQWTESLAFHQIAKHHFINRGSLSRYAPQNEDGAYLIIAHDDWLPNIQPLVDHKATLGMDIAAVGVSTIGNDAGSIKTYVQDVYDHFDLAFVLLVGDAAQVATPNASGGASDPSYAKLAGDDDYPDVLIGRFSAESAEDVDTQVERTIAYELGQATQQPWFKTAVGIGSAEGPGDDGEMDFEHVENIRTDLLGYGYSEVDQLYDPGATAAALTAALDQGRGIVNYCGHGNIGSFSTTGFNNTHVNALTNVDKLPIVISVACLNGRFNGGTCLGEAFLRATHEEAPSGAIAMYGSSINQSWSPPMAAQDEIADLLVSESYFTLGGLCFAGSARMMDDYGAAGVEMYNTWHLFGDPSVRVVGVAAPLLGIRVEPLDGLEAAGEAGGPFDVTEKVYTVESFADEAIDFSVAHQRPWVTVTPDSGTLQPGETTTVTVALNDEAETLADGYWQDTIEFVNETDHEGDCERAVGLTIGDPSEQYEWPLDSDPGWTTEGEWAFGQPTGNGGTQAGSPDPAAGYTGDNVYGYNLEGDYAIDLPATHLTSTAIDCSDLAQVSLSFWRWLNVEGATYDKASVSVSTDGETFTTVWQNSADALLDSEWQEIELDISEIADGQPSVTLRWTMGATDAGLCAAGWNIDDISIWSLQATCQDPDGDGSLPPECGGGDCDDSDDSVHPGADEVCDDEVDNDCDGLADDDDADCQGGGGASGGGDAPADGDDSDCGCQLPGAPTSNELGLWALVALLAGWTGRRRRPQHRRPGLTS